MFAVAARRQRFAGFWQNGFESIHGKCPAACGTKELRLRHLSSTARQHNGGTTVSTTKTRSGHRIPPLNGMGEKNPKNHRKSNGAKLLPPQPDVANGNALLSKKPKPDGALWAEANGPRTSLSSPTELKFTSDALIPVTSRLHIVTPEEGTPRGVWPIFRIMDEDGIFRDGSNDGYYCETAPSSQDLSIGKPVTGTTIKGASAEKNHDSSALFAFRASLCQKYPYLSSEIERNGLFHPSDVEYTDTHSKDTLRRLLRLMLRLREMDNTFQNAQRQGRISFYLTCRGEEAMHLGATSALERQDVILGQYREQGMIMWRGFTLQQFADQCLSNEADLGKGRQMPIHYGSRALNFQTISSSLGTQIPQAAGVAYNMKLSAARTNDETKKGVAICVFGDGCTSTGDFHTGLNFAATLKCPVIFFCRNNGYAISTSVKEQFAGDGVVSKAPGYGMAAIRIDGNDVFAVHAAVREARAYALGHNAPVLIEAMSYRQGHHSTSDDSSQYRSIEEVEEFARNSDPLDRLQKFFERHDYDEVTGETIQSMIEEEKSAILDALRTAERKPKPPLDDLFTDVYKDMPPSLQNQREQLMEHVSKYPDSYKL